VALASGIHRLRPENASLQVNTYREGMAAKVGHELVIEVTRWDAILNLTGSVVEQNADARSLEEGEGQLTMAGNTRPIAAHLNVGADGRVIGTIPSTQSEWGIKPCRGLMGALKLRDQLEIVVDAQLPAG
jgi:hypothetical protein